MLEVAVNFLNAWTKVRNEKRCYIEEWIDYHHRLGIEYFTFYNNGDPIAPLPHSTIIEWPGDAQQGAQADDYVQHHLNESLWIAIFDVDEFIVPHKWQFLPDMLNDYKTFGGLAISWLMFGSSGSLDDDRPQVVKFTRRSLPSFHANNHVKTIGRTDVITSAPNPHFFEYRDNFYSVNPDYQRVNGPFSHNLTNLVQINHYWSRSLPELDRKYRIPDAGGAIHDPVKCIEWEKHMNEVEDKSAIRIRERIYGGIVPLTKQ